MPGLGTAAAALVAFAAFVAAAAGSTVPRLRLGAAAASSTPAAALVAFAAFVAVAAVASAAVVPAAFFDWQP